MTEEMRVCQDAVALEIAMTFSERFQKNYPKEDLFQMTNDLALAIEAHNSGLKELREKIEDAYSRRYAKGDMTLGEYDVHRELNEHIAELQKGVKE